MDVTEICAVIEDYVRFELFCSVKIIQKTNIPRQSEKAGKRNLWLGILKMNPFCCF